LNRSTGIRALGLVLAVLLVPGCGLGDWWRNDMKLGPEYVLPEAAVSEAWIEGDEDRVLPAPSGHEEWWTVFEDPTLTALIDEACAQNLTLRQAGLRVLEARATREIAFGNLFPQSQGAFGSWSRTRASNEIAEIPPDRSIDTNSLGVGASWEIDVWGRFRRALESAEASLDASVYEYDSVLVCLVAQVAIAYADIRTFQQRLAYAHASADEQRESLELAELRYDAGKTDIVSVHLARSSLDSLLADIPTYKIGLRQANNALCTLLGRPPEDLLPDLGDGPIPSAPAEISVGIPADLLRRRPDVREAERQVAAQTAQIGVAISDLYPSIAIDGQLTVESEHFNDLFKDSEGGFMGISFSWNLLNYGRIENNILLQETITEELIAVYQQTVLLANQEVEDDLVSFLMTQEQVEALSRALSEAQLALDLLVLMFKEGKIDFNPIFVMQSDVIRLQDALAAAEGGVATSLINLYKSLGGGWQLHEADGELPAEVAEEIILTTGADVVNEEQHVEP